MRWQLTDLTPIPDDGGHDAGVTPKRPGSPASAVHPTALGWCATLLLVVLLAWGGPILWWQMETLPRDTTYRLPDANSEDYWAFAKWLTCAREADHVLLLGDSVVWGQYAAPAETLPACLNRVFPHGPRHANLGVNGGHPVALMTLAGIHARKWDGRRVAVCFNPFWISSPELDLQPGRNPPRLFHPRLLPQFEAGLTAYEASFPERPGTLVERRVPLLPLERHWRITWLDGKTWDNWMLDNPGALPLSTVGRVLPAPAAKAQTEPVPWHRGGAARKSAAWVPVAASRQAAAFLDLLRVLKERRASVLVLLATYNTHMLPVENVAAYETAMEEFGGKVRELGVPSVALPVLPSDLYGDASHPLPAGYERWAEFLARDPAYCRWAGQDPVSPEAPAAASVPAAAAPVPSAPAPRELSVQDARAALLAAEQVFVPGGRFMMGDARGREDETPHPVTVSAFRMDRHPVTQRLYEAVTGRNPARNKGPDLPVEQVRWAEAIAFCNRCSELEGLQPCYELKTGACDRSADGYRLPTEAEWEFACRAGTATRYPFGDEPATLESFAWHKANSGGKTRPVGTRRANPLGLFDMNGNVWEWCGDWYGPYAAGDAVLADPAGPATGEFKVLRGGAFDSPAERCRSAYRFKSAPHFQDVCEGFNSFGFRRVRSAGPEHGKEK